MLLSADFRYGDEGGQVLQDHISRAKGHGGEQRHGHSADEQISNYQPIANAPEEVAAKPAQRQDKKQDRDHPAQERNPPSKRGGGPASPGKLQEPLQQK